jgi:hypothetical protein
VPEDKFDLEVFTRADGKIVRRPQDLHACGAAACLLGWLPTWYPKDWEYRWGFPVHIEGDKADSPFRQGATWFGISYMHMQAIAAACHYPEYNNRPTPSQVADRIEKMVAEYNEKMGKKNEHGTTS